MVNLLGNHYLIDIEIESYDKLNSLEFIKSVCLDLVKLMKLTYLNEISHIFKPQGVSFVILLAESHISFHSFPEYLKGTLDIYSCQQEVFDIQKIIECLKKRMKINNINYKVIPRSI